MNVLIRRNSEGETLFVGGSPVLTGDPLDIEEVLSMLGHSVEVEEEEDSYTEDYD